jgi:hypothetical protein
MDGGKGVEVDIKHKLLSAGTADSFVARSAAHLKVSRLSGSAIHCASVELWWTRTTAKGIPLGSWSATLACCPAPMIPSQRGA